LDWLASGSRNYSLVKPTIPIARYAAAMKVSSFEAIAAALNRDDIEHLRIIQDEQRKR
jgi:hypothetical protein